MNPVNIQKLLSTYQTPLYVFDIPTLLDRIAVLRSRLPEKVSLCYAVKANPFLLRHLSGPMDRFEVCSPGELRICHSQELPPEKLVISGVVKDPGLMEKWVGSGPPVCAFTVESMRQWELFRRLSGQYRRRIPVLLRLTSGNQFGLSEEEVRGIACRHGDAPFLDIRGIQYFSGTQKTSRKRLQRELAYLDGFLEALSRESGLEIRELEYGPGLPVSYFRTDDWDEDASLEEFSRLLRSLNSPVSITLELGRSIAASCGSYYSQVLDTKSNNGQNYAILDGGMHHLVYYGQSMAMKQPFYDLFPERSTGEVRNWNLCGSLCTINDILVKQLPIQGLKPGDVVIFRNTGAYCMTEGISLFLSRNLPQVVLRLPDGRLVSVRDAAPTYVLNQASFSQG